MYRYPQSPPYHPRRPGLSMTLILNGLLCILFGLLVFAAPELLAYIVAAFLIGVGSVIVMIGWRMRR